VDGTLAAAGAATVGTTLGVTGIATFATHARFGDNDQIQLGDAQDALIYYDGSNMVLNPLAVGAGGVVITGGGNFQLARSNAGAFTTWSGSARSTLGVHHQFMDSGGTTIASISTSGAGGVNTEIDNRNAGPLHVGTSTTTTLVLGRSGQQTTLAGNVVHTGTSMTTTGYFGAGAAGTARYRGGSSGVATHHTFMDSAGAEVLVLSTPTGTTTLIDHVGILNIGTVDATSLVVGSFGVRTTVVGNFFHSSSSGLYGIFGVGPVAQPAAIDQTAYTTASSTVAVPTSTAVATTAATNIAPYGYTTGAQADDIVAQLNAARLDGANVKQNLNRVIDTLQALGVVLP
jgi:hypothetical protein